MKKIKLLTSVILIFAFVLALVPGMPVSAEESELDKHYKEVCGWIRENEETKEIIALRNAGKYEEALEVYKRKFLEFLVDIVPHNYANIDIERNTDYANDLRDKDIAHVSGHRGFRYEFYMGKVGEYKFDDKEAFYDIAVEDAGFCQQLAILNWAYCLPAEYIATNDISYVEKYFDICRDLDQNIFCNPEELARCMDSNLTLNGNPGGTRFLQWTRPLPVASRWPGRMHCIGLMAQKDIEATMKAFSNEEFMWMLKAFSNTIPNADIQISTQNQTISAVQGAIASFVCMQDMQFQHDNLPRVQAAFEWWLGKSDLPDGLDSEQSPNYNWGYIRNLGVIARYTQHLKEPVSWLGSMSDKVANRYKALTSLASPSGMVPNVGHNFSSYSLKERLNQYADMVDDRGTVERIASQVLGDGSLPEPAFTSVGFPYGGFYVMRNSWEKTSPYVYFKSGRMSNGHYDLSCLSMIYDAYGERLLIDAGPHSYHYTSQEIDRYLQTAFAHNTVTVNDQSQVTNRNTDFPDFMNINKALWYTSDKFDFVKDEYTNGYAKNVMEIWNQTKDITDVKHNRYIINDRENELNLVVDDMLTDGKYEYEQNWNFAYKFADYGSVICDADEKYIKTNLNDGKAGLEMYSIGEHPVEYEIRSGEREPDRGWYQYAYGTDYFAGLHIQSKWQGEKNSSMAMLINPTDKNESKIVNREAFADGNGMKLSLKNGNTIYILSSIESNNEISVGGLYFKGKTLYAIEKPDGAIYGVAYQTSDFKASGQPAPFRNNKFEFEYKNGEFKVIDTIKAPTGFGWKDTKNGEVPEYYYAVDNSNFRY